MADGVVPTRPIDAFTKPITSGMDPAPADAGQLSTERRAALAESLEVLATARAEAEVASRTYVVRGERSHG